MKRRVWKPIPKACYTCGEIFAPRRYNTEKFCSKKCQRRDERIRGGQVPLARRCCDWCHADFTQKIRSNERFCSRTCSQASWNARNVDHLRSYKRKYAKANHWQAEAWQARNRSRYLETERLKAQRRRARMANVAVQEMTPEQWRNVCATQRHRCWWCGARTGKLEIDHLVPISLGGDHSLENIVASCKTCNSRKCNAVWPKSFGALALAVVQ